MFYDKGSLLLRERIFSEYMSHSSIYSVNQTVGQTIANAIGKNFEEIAKFGRDKGPNKREIGAKKEIGVHAIRAGDIVGDHVVLYAGPGERIELKHQAHSRNCLASGAMTAIKFVANVVDNKIYTTQEVLGL